MKIEELRLLIDGSMLYMRERRRLDIIMVHGCQPFEESCPSAFA
jgi:hypothetical protein